MQQILNAISAELNPVGLLEKVMCRGKKELPFGEAALAWSVQSLTGATYVKSHTTGDVAESSRQASFDVNISAPDYKIARRLSPDQIYSRVQASAGMPEGDAIKMILERDIRGLTRDLKMTVEKQCGLLLTSADVEYTDDSSSVRNFPCYTGANPTSHTQSVKLQTTASGNVTHTTLECFDELVLACVAKGFRPDSLIVGATAASQILADKGIQEMFDRNMNKPGCIELGVEDGGSYLGRINCPSGAALDVYVCNEADGNTSFIGAKQGVAIASGCCTTAFGVNAFGNDSGDFEMKRERLSLTKRREGVDQLLYLASRAVIVPDSLAWQIATIAE